MDKIASLTLRATKLARNLFVKQSSVRKMAHVWAILAGSDPLLQALGRSLGAVFLLKGVKDLPDIHGKKAEEWLAEQPKKDINSLTRRLPSDYLDSVALKARNTIGSKFGPVAVQDAISKFLMKFVSMGKWEQMHSDLNLNAAMGYITTALRNEAMGLKKKDKHEDRHRSIDDTDDEGKAIFTPSDPKSLKDFLDHGKPIWHVPQVKRVLETKVHPDAPKFLDLLLEGYNQKEIVGDFRHKEVVVPSMLPHIQEKPISFSAWEYRTMPKIKDVLQRALVKEDSDNSSWAKPVDTRELLGLPKEQRI